MQSLVGNVVPTGWQGALNFTYNIGPGPAVVHLKLEMKFQVETL
jgi:N-acetylated-alpha-linked acidic dipeptidase